MQGSEEEEPRYSKETSYVGVCVSLDILFFRAWLYSLFLTVDQRSITEILQAAIFLHVCRFESQRDASHCFG